MSKYNLDAMNGDYFTIFLGCRRCDRRGGGNRTTAIRNLVQISTKIRINICIVQKKTLSLRRIKKICRYELHQA